VTAIWGGVLFVIALYADSQSSETVSETRLMEVTHSSEQLPYSLVADAGANAAQYSDSPQVRLQYVQNYAKGAVDALVWGMEINDDYATSAKICGTAHDAQLRTIECGYSKGIEAVIKKRIPVTLNDFGYVRITVYGRIMRDAAADLKYVQVGDEQLWLLAPSNEYESLDPDDCYQLTGYLSRESGFGTRSRNYSGEFVVVDAKQAGHQCPDKH
jgi:hypothetical protein